MGCPPATTYNYYYSIFYSTRLNPCCPLLPPAAAAAARPPTPLENPAHHHRSPSHFLPSPPVSDTARITRSFSNTKDPDFSTSRTTSTRPSDSWFVKAKNKLREKTKRIRGKRCKEIIYSYYNYTRLRLVRDRRSQWQWQRMFTSIVRFLTRGWKTSKRDSERKETNDRVITGK